MYVARRNLWKHSYEIACLETLDNEPVHDSYELDFKGNSEEEKVVLDSFENKDVI